MNRPNWLNNSSRRQNSVISTIAHGDNNLGKSNVSNNNFHITKPTVPQHIISPRRVINRTSQPVQRSGELEQLDNAIPALPTLSQQLNLSVGSDAALSEIGSEFCSIAVDTNTDISQSSLFNLSKLKAKEERGSKSEPQSNINPRHQTHLTVSRKNTTIASNFTRAQQQRRRTAQKADAQKSYVQKRASSLHVRARGSLSSSSSSSSEKQTSKEEQQEEEQEKQLYNKEKVKQGQRTVHHDKAKTNSKRLSKTVQCAPCHAPLSTTHSAIPSTLCSSSNSALCSSCTASSSSEASSASTSFSSSESSSSTSSMLSSSEAKFTDNLTEENTTFMSLASLNSQSQELADKTSALATSTSMSTFVEREQNHNAHNVQRRPPYVRKPNTKLFEYHSSKHTGKANSEVRERHRKRSKHVNNSESRRKENELSTKMESPSLSMLSSTSTLATTTTNTAATAQRRVANKHRLSCSAYSESVADYSSELTTSVSAQIPPTSLSHTFENVETELLSNAEHPCNSEVPSAIHSHTVEHPYLLNVSRDNNNTSSSRSSNNSKVETEHNLEGVKDSNVHEGQIKCNLHQENNMCTVNTVLSSRRQPKKQQQEEKQQHLFKEKLETKERHTYSKERPLYTLEEEECESNQDGEEYEPEYTNATVSSSEAIKEYTRVDEHSTSTNVSNTLASSVNSENSKYSNCSKVKKLNHTVNCNRKVIVPTQHGRRGHSLNSTISSITTNSSITTETKRNNCKNGERNNNNKNNKSANRSNYSTTTEENKNAKRDGTIPTKKDEITSQRRSASVLKTFPATRSLSLRIKSSRSLKTDESLNRTTCQSNEKGKTHNKTPQNASGKVKTTKLTKRKEPINTKTVLSTACKKEEQTPQSSAPIQKEKSEESERLKSHNQESDKVVKDNACKQDSKNISQLIKEATPERQCSSTSNSTHKNKITNIPAESINTTHKTTTTTVTSSNTAYADCTNTQPSTETNKSVNSDSEKAQKQICMTETTVISAVSPMTLSINDDETVEVGFDYNQVEKLERIGRGSYGCVYRALYKATSTIIAVKEVLVPKDFTKDLERQLITLEREIRVMRKLDHPNTIRYLGARRDDNCLSIYMEYVNGGTIGRMLKECGPFNEEVTRSYTLQLLRGLEYLHERKIIHRDLKGDNLFLTDANVLKLGDFGTSKELVTSLVTDSVAGTPNFMAPEVIACTGHSYKADIWSVGCCVLEMLTGQPPFTKLDNHMAVMFAVMKGKIVDEIPTSISTEAKSFIEMCTKTNPTERWTSTQLLHHIWLTGVDVHSSSSSAPSLEKEEQRINVLASEENNNTSKPKSNDADKLEVNEDKHNKTESDKQHISSNSIDQTNNTDTIAHFGNNNNNNNSNNNKQKRKGRVNQKESNVENNAHSALHNKQNSNVSSNTATVGISNVTDNAEVHNVKERKEHHKDGGKNTITTTSTTTANNNNNNKKRRLTKSTNNDRKVSAEAISERSLNKTEKKNSEFLAKEQKELEEHVTSNTLTETNIISEGQDKDGSGVPANKVDAQRHKHKARPFALDAVALSSAADDVNERHRVGHTKEKLRNDMVNNRNDDAHHNSCQETVMVHSELCVSTPTNNNNHHYNHHHGNNANTNTSSREITNHEIMPLTPPSQLPLLTSTSKTSSLQRRSKPYHDSTQPSPPPPPLHFEPQSLALQSTFTLPSPPPMQVSHTSTGSSGSSSNHNINNNNNYGNNWQVCNYTTMPSTTSSPYVSLSGSKRGGQFTHKNSVSNNENNTYTNNSSTTTSNKHNHSYTHNNNKDNSSNHSLNHNTTYNGECGRGCSNGFDNNYWPNNIHDELESEEPKLTHTTGDASPQFTRPRMNPSSSHWRNNEEGYNSAHRLASIGLHDSSSVDGVTTSRTSATYTNNSMNTLGSSSLAHCLAMSIRDANVNTAMPLGRNNETMMTTKNVLARWEESANYNRTPLSSPQRVLLRDNLSTSMESANSTPSRPTSLAPLRSARGLATQRMQSKSVLESSKQERSNL